MSSSGADPTFPEDLEICGEEGLELLGLFSFLRLSAPSYWLGRDFARPVFAQLTHLDLPGHHTEQWAIFSPLASIPGLTHLFFSQDFISSLFNNILKHCKSLEVLAIVFSYLAMLKFTVLILGLQPSSFDPRLVLLVVADRQADWETGARGGGDYWLAAERLAEKHHGGDFDGTFPRSGL
ncbi:hypothetical protein B0H13DRAFT_2666306 [Mycena leptocephala]|nr:hypothetical protein B0H13DRAFT_2666306 [Mycena leptocephala]